MNELNTKLVDASTIIAATAGLWALAFGWLTYVMSVRQQYKEEFQSLRSIIAGLRIELDRMKDWTGAGGAGYSKEMPPAPDWSKPGRLIYKFDIEAISKLTLSPLLYRLGDIVEPFAKLNFSVSRLFQVYDEYRNFANSNPGVLASPPPWYTDIILYFNQKMHIQLIGGADSDDPVCLYKTYAAAVSALDNFDADLSVTRCRWWFWIGHFSAGAFVGAGIVLLIRLAGY